MKRAFTLIELLVVIAIIAILAAILFPVFAQAKEAAKKTQSLSNIKQSATSFAIYGADADDNLPSAYPIAAGNACDGLANGTTLTMQWQWAATTPAGADGAACGATDETAWVNSIQPYMKNYDLMTLPGKQTRDTYTAAYMATFIKAPTLSSISMNGLLNQWSQTAINNPSVAVLLWPGSFGHNFRGGLQFHGSPSLFCPVAGSAPCRFNPNGEPQAGGGLTSGRGDQFFSWVTLSNSLWLYGRGFNVARTDSSAKFVSQGVGRSTRTPVSVDANGVFNGTVRCQTTTTAPLYNAWFRPDTDQQSYPAVLAGLCGF